MRAAHEAMAGEGDSIACVRCGRPIHVEEALCCRTCEGIIVASSYRELKRLMHGGREPVRVFHLRCCTP
jgi:ribosomal protein S26